MFERFSSAARRAMVLAHEEAQVRGHNFIGAEHLALGILRADAETSGGLFERLGVGPNFVEQLDAEAGAGAAPPSPETGKPPFTPRAKKAMERSLREALDLGQNWIGLGHVLLGVLRVGDLKALSDHLPAEVQGIVARWEADQQAPGEADQRSALRFRLRARPRPNPRSETNVAEGFTRVVHAAHQQTPGPVGSQHLLLGMFEAGDTLARRVLEQLGVTEEKVRELIDKVGPEGTIDEPPRPEYEVRIGEHSIRVDDPESRDRLRRILDEDPDLAEGFRAALDRKTKEAGS